MKEKKKRCSKYQVSLAIAKKAKYPPYVCVDDIKVGYVFWGEVIEILRSWSRESVRPDDPPRTKYSQRIVYNYVYRAQAWFRNPRILSMQLRCFEYESTGSTTVNPKTHWLYDVGNYGSLIVPRPPGYLLKKSEVEHEKRLRKKAQEAEVAGITPQSRKWAKKGNDKERPLGAIRSSNLEAEAESAKRFLAKVRNLEERMRKGEDVALTMSLKELKETMDSAERMVKTARYPDGIAIALKMLSRTQLISNGDCSSEAEKSRKIHQLKRAETIFNAALEKLTDLLDTAIDSYNNAEVKGEWEWSFEERRSEIQYLKRVYAGYQVLGGEDYYFAVIIDGMLRDLEDDIREKNGVTSNQRGTELRGLGVKSRQLNRGTPLKTDEGIPLSQRGTLGRGVPV